MACRRSTYLVVNLYPFEETVAAGADAPTVVENIDIGGPAMIRAAAKNHAHVTVVTDASDYDAIVRQRMDANAGSCPARPSADDWPAKAYARTAAYDARIAGWFAAEARRRLARNTVACRTQGETSALWRKPAPAGRILSDARCARSGRPGVATQRKFRASTVLQQSE